MARIVKEEEYAARRSDILNVAQQFIYSKGFAAMSIQDILDALGISKGAFYHYFDSKQALLEALIERMEEEAVQFMIPIIEDPNLHVMEKLDRFFLTGVRWKTERKDFFLALTRAWYADENAIVRQKVELAMVKRFAPMLAGVIRQGIEEKTLDAPYPDETAEVVLAMLLGLGVAFTDLLLHLGAGPASLPRAESILAAYTSALERVLGAPPGSVQIIDLASMKEWLEPQKDQQPEIDNASLVA